jgi:hypothetical protein
MASATFAHGTKLSLVSTEIPLCDDITLTLPEADVIEVPDHSNSTGYRTYILGLKGKGKVTTTFAYDAANATHVALIAAHSGAAQAFVITLTGSPAKTFSFSAFVKVGVTAPEASFIKIPLELTITGAVT